MGNPIVPLPPKGYKADVKPPTGYLLDSATAPISPDLEDRRGLPVQTGKVTDRGVFVRQVWDEVKKELRPSYFDTSFYDPTKDASRQVVSPSK